MIWGRLAEAEALGVHQFLLGRSGVETRTVENYLEQNNCIWGVTVNLPQTWECHFGSSWLDLGKLESSSLGIWDLIWGKDWVYMSRAQGLI